MIIFFWRALLRCWGGAGGMKRYGGRRKRVLGLWQGSSGSTQSSLTYILPPNQGKTQTNQGLCPGFES